MISSRDQTVDSPQFSKRRQKKLLLVFLSALLLIAGSLVIERRVRRIRMQRMAASQSVLKAGTRMIPNTESGPGNSSNNEMELLSAFAPPVVNGDMAWLRDYRGRLLVSRDHGQFWDSIAGDVPAQFSDFTMLDTSHGWAAAEDGKIWKTDDAGYNWYVIGLVKPDDPDEFYHGASQIVFSDANHGWVLDSFFVWKTVDGGYSWNEDKELSVPTSSVRRIHMVNARVGWAVCKGDLLRTEDGGNKWRSLRRNTWLRQYTTITAFSASDESQACLAAIDAPYPDNAMLCTENGGTSWYQPKGFNDQFAIYSLFFLNGTTGWAAGGGADSFESYFGKGVLFKTEDGGKTWRNVSSAPMANTLRSVHFTSREEGLMASDYDVYATQDGGRTWSNALSYPEVRERNRQAYYGTNDKTSSALLTRN